jgi:hypothetical protein
MRKLPIFLFFAALISFGTLTLYSKNAQPKGVKPTLPINPVALYQSDNELYFDNKLPKADVVGEEPPGDRSAGKVWLASTEHTPGSHYYKMYISPRYNPYWQDEEGSILHESCHIYVWEQVEARGGEYDDGHNEEWQDCMKSLALKNAFKSIW